MGDSFQSPLTRLPAFNVPLNLCQITPGCYSWRERVATFDCLGSAALVQLCNARLPLVTLGNGYRAGMSISNFCCGKLNGVHEQQSLQYLSQWPFSLGIEIYFFLLFSIITYRAMRRLSSRAGYRPASG